MKATIQINHGNTRMIAHRGAAKVWVENSLPAFENSSKLSYWGIETDIHCTSDGQFILTHDDNTFRVTGKDYFVEATDFATLREVKLLGIKGEDSRMPTLEEYVAICKSNHKICVLELKNYMPENEIKKIVSCIQKLGYLKSVVFISFIHSNLLTLQALLPNQPMQFLISQNYLEEKMELVRKHPMDIDVDYRAVTKELVDEIHALGCRINCWTVNDPNKAAELIALGVDFITTDILE